MTESLEPLDWRAIFPPLEELSPDAQQAIKLTFEFTLAVMLKNFKRRRTVGGFPPEPRGIFLVIKEHPELPLNALHAWHYVDKSEDQAVNFILGIDQPTTRARSGPNRAQRRVLDVGHATIRALSKYMIDFADSRTPVHAPAFQIVEKLDNNRERFDINYAEMDWKKFLEQEQKRTDLLMSELITVLASNKLSLRVDACHSTTNLDFISLGLSFMRSGFRSPEKAIERATLSLAT